MALFDNYLSPVPDLVSRSFKITVLSSIGMRSSIVDFFCTLPERVDDTIRVHYGTKFLTLLALRRLLEKCQLRKRARSREALDLRFLWAMHWLRKYPTEDDAILKWKNESLGRSVPSHTASGCETSCTLSPTYFQRYVQHLLHTVVLARY